jgi:hypothetical protein
VFVSGKRRRRRPSGSDGEEDGTRSGSNSGGNSSFPSIGGMWTPRHLSDLKVSSIYNRNSAEAPAEVRSAVTSVSLPIHIINSLSFIHSFGGEG